MVIAMNDKNERIIELETLLEELEDKSSFAYLQGVNSLKLEYEHAREYGKAKHCADNIIDMIVNKSITYPGISSKKINEMLVHAYDTKARCGDFRAYCIALEWNRPVEKKFYIPRMKVLEKHGVMDAFQDLQDDKLDLLVLNMPPRVGKTTLSLFFLTFRAGLYPEQSILGNGHSTSLMQSFYTEFLGVINGDEYRFHEIFPSVQMVNKSAEYLYVDLCTNKRFHSVNFRSVDSGTTGVVEASNLLYCDDMVKDVDTANSKDRLDRLFGTYTSTIKDRKVPRRGQDGMIRPCPELHVNTPWSVNDVTNRIIRAEEEKGNNDRVRVISIPCWDENHESNFMYDYGKGFDVKYYEDMEAVEDPVIFMAKYLMKCVERDGRPFEKNSLSYYTELPDRQPDQIVAYNDVSHGGDDFMSMPIGYVYGQEIYIVDVLFIHNFGGDSFSRPLVCKKLIEYGVTRCGFEKNNGGDFYSSLITSDLRDLNYRCNITSHNAPTTQNKLNRILSCQNEIKGVAVLRDSFKIYFRDPSMIPRNSEYYSFMDNLWNWSQKEGRTQKKQHDDSCDSLAGMIVNVLGKCISGRARLFDISEAGY